MRNDEKGYIVVETVCAFIPFVLLVISILSLVNIITLQTRIHYALTQAAKTMSVYSYLLEVTGVANDLTALSYKAGKTAAGVNELRNELEGVLEAVQSLSGAAETISRVDSLLNRVYGWGEAEAGQPQTAMSQLMAFGQNELKNQAFEIMVRPLVGRYLMNGDMTGDAYLRSVGVRNRHTDAMGLSALEFFAYSNLGLGNSALIDKDGNIKLTVQYEVEYSFGALPLPFRPTLSITQTAITKAWLNGSGKGYW